jgi:hypothetical protein
MTTDPSTWQDILSTVEQLSQADQLRLVSELLNRMARLANEREPTDLLDLSGVGAEVWSGIDSTDYLNQERDSWQT